MSEPWYVKVGLATAALLITATAGFMLGVIVHFMVMLAN